MIRRLKLWFYTKQYDGAMRRCDIDDALWWQRRIEQLGGW